ncbi:MAG: flagellar hook protein FlgE [Firmicutes bacterium]|nr:flagellar hook protein FlgE [Bacillota bacterium]
MMRSLFAGVSGLLTHQTRMDVIGNNIANVNTVGYKASRVTFKDMLYQTMQAATRPTSSRGGTNPKQVGLGVQIGSIDVLHTEGNLQPTGVQTDLAIRGNGFFVLLDGSEQLYTRAGVFDIDSEGWLVSKTSGMRVAGWMANNGQIDPNQPVQAIQIPKNQTLPAQATTSVVLEGNLDAGAATGTTVQRSVTVYDSLGRQQQVVVTFTRAATANQWDWVAQYGGNSVGSGSVTFDASGQYNSGSPGSVTFNPGGGASAVSFSLDFTRLTQSADPSEVSVRSQDGFPAGTLEEIRIDGTGTVTGIFSNGLTRDLAQLALASFPNPGGLEQVGETVFRASQNSGLVHVGTPGSGGRGIVTPGNLEMSNVNLSEEFTSMIVTQRGFQANSRIITASDEMLQELVNLKR